MFILKYQTDRSRGKKKKHQEKKSKKIEKNKEY